MKHEVIPLVDEKGTLFNLQTPPPIEKSLSYASDFCLFISAIPTNPSLAAEHQHCRAEEILSAST